ncbi:reverse transcriptase domain-containing protein [Tanacetum coccineum]
MSTHEQITNNPTSAVRNTGGRNGPQGLEEPMSDEILREMCDKNYHQLLPLIAEKMQKEKEQKDKLNAVKARLIYGEESGIKIRSREESHYSESKTPTARTEPRRRHGDRYSRSPSPHASVFKRLKKNRSPSPQPRPRKEGGVFNRLGRKEPATSARSDSRRRSPQAKRTEVETRRRQQKRTPSRTTSQYSESEDSEGGHWKSKSRRQRSNTYEDDLSQPWTCEERNPFTPRIRHFSLPRTRMPSHVKTYDGSGDPEDHLKLFQSAAKIEESIDSYEDLRTAFRENYLQQTKHIKDPVEIHHIKQRDGESTEDFMERYKAEVLDVEGAPECMRISGFMHGITHPGLIKRLYERIPRSMDEMYRMTTSFLQGEVAALSHGQRKTPSWKPSEGGNKPNFKKGFKNKQRPDRKPDRFSLLTKTPKEIFALEKGKFKAPPPMVTPVEKRDPNKYCEFHSDTGHSTDECMQLRKLTSMEMIKGQKISQGRRAPNDHQANWAELCAWVLRDGGHRSEVLAPSNTMHIMAGSRHKKISALYHQQHTECCKFPVEGGTVTLQSSRVIPMECAMISGPSTQPLRNEPIKGRKKMFLASTILIIFAWKPADMTGVPRSIAEHRLNIREGYSPVRQKKRGQAPERNKTIQEEVEKLVDAGIMKEVHLSQLAI